MIYKFETLIEYFEHIYEQKKKRNALFSLRAWARLLGYNSPSLLSQVLKGDRKVNLKLIEAVCRTENLTPEEEKYIQLLYIKHSVRIPSTDLFGKLFNTIRPDMSLCSDFLKKFDCFSSWHPFFIVELTKIKSFCATRENIVHLLSSCADVELIVKALEELIKADLLELEGNVYKKGISGRISFEPEVANVSVKLFHHSSLRHAQTVLEEQDRSIRDFRSTMVALNHESYEEACKIIQEAHQKISKMASKKGEADVVYEFNSQFYMPIVLEQDTK